MKEASGEVSMTLIVIVAAAVILAIFMGFKDKISDFITTKWDDFMNTTEIVIPSDNILK